MTDASWDLIELSSIHDVADGTGEDVAALLARVDWDLVIARSLRHRLMPRLADFLIRSGLMASAPKPVRRALVNSLNANRFHCETTTREASRVVTAIQDAGVVVACTKGVAFQASLYGGFGGRDFGDIDLMIDESDRHTVGELLPELGYQAHLEHDFVTNTIVRRPPQDLMIHRLYPDHLPHFVRPVSGHITPFHDVDVCFDLTWHGAAWRVPMSEVLAEPATVEVRAGDDVIRLPSLPAEFDFVFTATHLFREAWFERNLEGQTIRLGQFADLWRLWRRLDAPLVASLSALIERHDIAPPIAWACHHVDDVFGSRMVDGLGLQDYCDPAWLHSVGGSNGSCLTWDGGMRERLRSGTPPVLSPTGEPPFAAQARVRRR